LRAGAFIVEFAKTDKEAIAWFALVVGFTLIVMTRLICNLPRRAVRLEDYGTSSSPDLI